MEAEAPGYPVRTRANIVNSDGTLLVGQYRTGGSALTFRIARELNKPMFHVKYPRTAEAHTENAVEEFRTWLETHRIRTLNIAGDRESASPGIFEFTRQFLSEALRQTEP